MMNCFFCSRSREELFASIRLRGAARDGDVQELYRALREGADPQESDEDLGGVKKLNALMLAAREGHHDCVKLLLQANPEAAKKRDENGQTAFLLAMSNGHHACVRELLPASVTCACDRDLQGATPLILAAMQCDVPLVTLLLPVSDAMAVDAQGHTALMHCASRGCVAGVHQLLPVSNLNTLTQRGLSAVMLAAKHAQASTLSLLLEARECAANATSTGAEKETINRENKMALGLAIENEAWACVELLMSRVSLEDTPADFLDAPWASRIEAPTPLVGNPFNHEFG